MALLNLKNKKIVISAGASGIGWATAKICLSKGAIVYVCDIDIKKLNNLMIKKGSQLGTLASNISNKKLFENPNVVKVITKELLDISSFPEAVNFTRTISKNDTEKIYHHLGIYCYKKETLKKFVSLSQSKNEIQNRLEQMRALDNNIKINVAYAKYSPIGVDTKEDFVAIKKIMEYKS